MKYIIILFVCVTLLLYINGCNCSNTVECTVYSIEKIQDIREKHTEIYWLVSTDKGTYSIQSSGMWAHPELLGKIKVDSTYIFTVEGFNVPFLGEYPRIICTE